jgi:phosphoserine aminotransferase
MSSDIFSRLDFTSLIYYIRRSSKMGPAGTTLIIVKEEILGKSGRTIPVYWITKTHQGREYVYSPPVFLCMHHYY